MVLTCEWPIRAGLFERLLSRARWAVLILALRPMFAVTFVHDLLCVRVGMVAVKVFLAAVVCFLSATAVFVAFVLLSCRLLCLEHCWAGASDWGQV